MGTWAGAIVETRGVPDFAAIAAKHGIVVHGEVGAWVLVGVNLNFSRLSLRPPTFAGPLSRELGGTVIAFFTQKAVGVQQLEHWVRGERLRTLEVSPDGAWTHTGVKQDWEADFFLGEEPLDRGEYWPTLRHGLGDADLERCRQAWAARDASGIFDLLVKGDLGALCSRFELEVGHPAAHFTTPTNWKPWIVAAALVMAALGPSFLITRLELGLSFFTVLTQTLALVSVAVALLIALPFGWSEWRRRRRHLNHA